MPRYLDDNAHTILEAILRQPTVGAFAAGKPLHDLVNEYIEAAEDTIDDLCGIADQGGFLIAPAEPSAKVFWPTGPDIVATPNTAAAEATITYGQGNHPWPGDWEWVHTPTATLPGRHLRRRGPYRWPIDTRLTVATRWGYPVIPRQAKLAVRMLAGRLALEEETPLGVTTVGEFAKYIAKRDSRIQKLINSLAAQSEGYM